MAAGRNGSRSDGGDSDGELLVDDTARREAATDFGRAVQRSPVAVLKPRSVADIARIVAYANTRGLKLAMRGRGHSLSGQAQAEGGIVIDSSMLSAVRWQEGDTLDAEPGAMWGDVAKTALARGRTPPVMPDAMMLSVGAAIAAAGAVGSRLMADRFRLSSCMRAVVYDSPVFRMRVRTRRLKSLLAGIVSSFGQATGDAPQQTRLAAPKTTTMRIRESAPLCLARTRAGQGQEVGRGSPPVRQ